MNRIDPLRFQLPIPPDAVLNTLIAEGKCIAAVDFIHYFSFGMTELLRVCTAIEDLPVDQIALLDPEQEPKATFPVLKPWMGACTLESSATRFDFELMDMANARSIFYCGEDIPQNRQHWAFGLVITRLVRIRAPDMALELLNQYPNDDLHKMLRSRLCIELATYNPTQALEIIKEQPSSRALETLIELAHQNQNVALDAAKLFVNIYRSHGNSQQKLSWTREKVAIALTDAGCEEQARIIASEIPLECHQQNTLRYINDTAYRFTYKAFNSPYARI